MGQTGTVSTICISNLKGIPRPRVMAGELQSNLGFVGNRLSKGGNRQICLFDEETYAALRSEGAKVESGSFGENITTTGLDYALLAPGDTLKVGDEAVIEITMVRQPCSNLTQLDSRLPALIVGRSGWLAKVINSGTVQTGDQITLQAAATICS